MTPRTLIGAGLIVVVAIAGVLLSRKTKTPEQQIRELIAACVLAAEKRDLGTIGEAMADDFRGPSGSNKAEVKQVILGHLFRNQNQLVVFNPSLDVVVTGDQASFHGTFVFARSKEVNWQAPGDGVTRYDIEGTLERRGSDWKITSAEWLR
jgi:hypothetical protein